ncbi:MAG TPA: methionyl-tRNA formyltransferase, partial [Candidatus Glassbacteria bacterium]|nr:methionyl-tRNA formyltransferase [Candidatus Glassbacteria bacterium]
MAANANIVFLGTAEFAVPILQALIENDQKPVLVITRPDQPAGRKQLLQAPPVKSAGRTAGIPVSQPESSTRLDALLR